MMPPRRGTDAARARIEALYQQPSAAFVASRNALAAALRKEGDAGTAESVKRLVKPSPGAWALNQIYWRDRPLFDRMIRAGDAVRALQQQMLAGRPANLREATAERQAALAAVVERAVALLAADGNLVTAATRQRLATSADALASFGSAARGCTPGQMVEDLEAPGFAALASLGGAPLRLVQGGRSAGDSPTPPAAPLARADPKAERRADKERVATAKRDAAERIKAVRAAEQALRDATRELESVRQRAARARATAESLAQEQRTLDEQAARLAARRRAADAAAVEASEAVAAAERTRRDAESALTAARQEPSSRR
jgi:hypothetical protein